MNDCAGQLLKTILAAYNMVFPTNMKPLQSRILFAGGMFSAVVALMHVGCIVFGAPWYRAMGAGERMARMAAAGHWYPTALTTLITVALAVWSLYAFSGAGVIRRLPLLRTVIFGTGAVYLIRGVGAAAFVPFFPGNSLSFWLVTSAACTVAAALHLVGLKQIWSNA